MEPNKLSTIFNLSSQGNLCNSRKSYLTQLNYIIILGLNHLNQQNQSKQKFPITITIQSSGEMQIDGIDEKTIKNKDHVRIYSDKKITLSKDMKN